MNRSHLFALAGVAVLALGGAGCAPSDPSARSGGSSPETAAAGASGGAAVTDPASFLPTGSQRPPNILLVTVDTLRADHLSAWGYKRATSPN
ncbi:MAG: cell wall anchor protein, partial [Thermoanaerobaculia bacterium]|nr:cell wall anchor protein [Thermoanaerobaculia bacterium]